MSLLTSILTPPKTVAVVGLSENPERPSHVVASYLRAHGFTIIPVNPKLTTWMGLPAFPSIAAIPATQHIDIVDIFRRSEEVPALVQEVLATGRTPVIWMQEGVVSPEAKQLAEAAGLTVIMNACMMKEHHALGQSDLGA